MADKNISYLQLDIGNGLTTQNGLVKLYIDPDCGLELSSDGLYCSLDALYSDTINKTTTVGISFEQQNQYGFLYLDADRYYYLKNEPEQGSEDRDPTIQRYRMLMSRNPNSAPAYFLCEESNGSYIKKPAYLYTNASETGARKKFYIDKELHYSVGYFVDNNYGDESTITIGNVGLCDIGTIIYPILPSATSSPTRLVLNQPFYEVKTTDTSLPYKMISTTDMTTSGLSIILFVDKNTDFSQFSDMNNKLNIETGFPTTALLSGSTSYPHFTAYMDKGLTKPFGDFYCVITGWYDKDDNAYNPLYESTDLGPNTPFTGDIIAVELKCYNKNKNVGEASTTTSTTTTTTTTTDTSTDTSSSDSSSSDSSSTTTTTTTTTTASREVDETGSFGFEVDRSALVDNWTVVLVDQDKPNDRIHLYPDQQISDRLSSLLIGTQSTIPLDLIIDKFKYEKELIKCNRNVVQSCYSFCMYRMSRKIGTSDTVRLVKQSALKTCDDLITELNFPLRAKYLNLLKNFGGSSYHTDMPSSSSKTSRTDDEMYTEDSKPPLFVDRSDSGFTKTPPMLKVGNLISFTDHAFVTVLRYSTNLLKGHVTGSDLLYSDERIWDDTNDVLIDENASTNDPFKPFTVDSDGKYHISIKGKVVGDQFLLPTIDPYYWPYEDGQRHAYNTMVDSEDGLTSTPIGHVYAMFVVEEIEYFDPTEISRIVDKSIRHSNSSISDNNIALSDFGYRDTGFNQVIPMIKRMKIRCIWSDQSYNNNILDHQGWRVGEAQEGQAIVYGQEFNEYSSDLDAPVLMKISDYYQYIKDNLDEYDHENAYKESYSPTVWVGRVELASDVNNKIDITFSQKCNTYANNNF
jgi:hypothetical protein